MTEGFFHASRWLWLEGQPNRCVRLLEALTVSTVFLVALLDMAQGNRESLSQGQKQCHLFPPLAWQALFCKGEPGDGELWGPSPP